MTISISAMITSADLSKTFMKKKSRLILLH